MTATKPKARDALLHLAALVKNLPDDQWRAAFDTLREFIDETYVAPPGPIYRYTDVPRTEYEVLAYAVGLGRLRDALFSDLVIFRNTATHQIFARTRNDFDKQMQRVR